MNIYTHKQKNKNKSFELKGLGAKLIIVLSLFLIPNIAFAVTQSDLNKKANELNKAKNQLKQITAQRQTLQGEIAYYDSQISSLQSQIYTTNDEISKLNNDITATNIKINSATKKIQEDRQKLGDVLKVSYEEGQISTIELIASSTNFSDFVNRSEYFDQLQLKIKSTVDQINAIKANLEISKQQLEANRARVQDLKSQQVARQQQISQQKTAKDYLLLETKGDEAAYQTLVKKIQSDYARLQSQLWGSSGNYVSLGKVKTGDIIGYIGNSGYSTGCHLHFEIRNGSQSAVNPASYIGNGYFINPVPGVRISAPYGYSSAYFPGVFHTGIDYADGCRATPIRATGPGDIVARVSGRPNTYPGSVEYGNYVKIKHTNGMYSLYGHLR